MPRIPFSLASGEVPGRIPLREEASPAGWAMTGKALQGLAEEMGSQADIYGRVNRREAEKQAEVERKLKAEQDEMEAISLVSEYDTNINTLKAEIERSPDPLQHQAMFTRGSQKILDELGKRTTSRVVGDVLKKNALRKFPAELEAVRKQSYALHDQTQLAWLDRMEEEQSTKAVNSGTEEERKDAESLYTGVVSRFEQRGILNPVKAEELRQRFTRKTTEKRMRAAARTDPTGLYKRVMTGEFDALDQDTLTRNLEAARKGEEHAEARRKASYEEAKKAVNERYELLANNNGLSDAFIRDAMAGKVNFIDASDARRLKSINESKETDEGDKPTLAIMQAYSLTQGRPKDVTNALVELRRLADTLGKPSKAIRKAGDQLQSDYYRDRAVGAAELSAGKQSSVESYRATAPPRMPGMLGSMGKNYDDVMESLIRANINKGMSPEKAAQEAIKLREAQYNAIPSKRRSVMDLVE